MRAITCQKIPVKNWENLYWKGSDISVTYWERRSWYLLSIIPYTKSGKDATFSPCQSGHYARPSGRGQTYVMLVSDHEGVVRDHELTFTTACPWDINLKSNAIPEGGGGKSRILNWQYFNLYWLGKITGVDWIIYLLLDQHWNAK